MTLAFGRVFEGESVTMRLAVEQSDRERPCTRSIRDWRVETTIGSPGNIFVGWFRDPDVVAPVEFNFRSPDQNNHGITHFS